jgi:hypothetical protein
MTVRQGILMQSGLGESNSRILLGKQTRLPLRQTRVDRKTSIELATFSLATRRSAC